MTSYSLGDDGDIQAGVAWPSPRFTDNEDGTVTDNLTGLIWLEDANCSGRQTLDLALSNCNNLADGSCGLEDGSVPGDWRLPNVNELRSLIHADKSNISTWLNGQGFMDVQARAYLSSTTCALYPHPTWLVSMKAGISPACQPNAIGYVWPVRAKLEVEVEIDIKPGSCPNSFDVKSKGVLPVAVLGTEDFDVTTIDPSSIRLTRELVDDCYVRPIRWSYEDVATPFEGELCDCHDLNGDGCMDLTLKFDTQELVIYLALEEVAGETIPLTLTGNLKEEAGGTPITGEDCLRILNPGGGKK